MAKAQSFKSEPWTSFQKGSWKIFDTDFLHDLLGFKISKKCETSTIQVKSSFSLSKEGKVSEHKEEVKFWFPIPNSRTLYFRLKGDHWKFMIDNGVQERKGLNLNLYGSVQGKRELGSESYKVGLEVADKDWSSNVRVTSVPNDKKIEVYNKTSISRDKWRWEFINGLNFSNNTWSHSTVQVSHSCSDSDYNLRTDGGKKHSVVHPKNYLTNIIGNYIYHYSQSTTVGIELNLDMFNPKIISGASAIWDYVKKDTPNTGIKIKADLNRNLAVAITNDMRNYGKYIFGLHVADFGQSNRFGYGVEINLNL